MVFGFFFLSISGFILPKHTNKDMIEKEHFDVYKTLKLLNEHAQLNRSKTRGGPPKCFS